MKILMVTKFLPIPADSGGKQRSSAVLRRLVELGEVTICSFDDGAADHGAFRDLGVRVKSLPRPGMLDVLLGVLRTRSISSGRFWSRAFVKELRAIIAEGEIDCLVIAYGQLGPYASVIPARHRVLDLHNIESALFQSYASSTTGLRKLLSQLESIAMRRIEKRALKSFDTVIVVSEQDASRLPAAHPNVLICPNGWDPSPPLPMGESAKVVFVGLMSWAPNADAAEWLVGEVWPYVREQVPDAHLSLVGKDPTSGVKALGAHDITVTGTVPDVKPYLGEARVAVAPLRAGGGSRLKILEALNSGRPVVATSIGAEGLEHLVDKGILIADAPQVFAKTVVELLEDRPRAETLGLVGNSAVNEYYSWDATLAPLIRDIYEMCR